MKPTCQKCNGNGYVLVYQTRVIRMYCECKAGDRVKKEVMKSLEKYSETR
jgi:excinuclease UvrABC ATPase subunit